MRDNLVAVPVSLKDAHKYVGHLHRHRKALPDWQSNMQDLVAVGAAKHGKLVGVAILSRPFSRFVADGETIEVSRLCTDGTRNACSFLYAKSARAAEALGFRRVITYILYGDEPGTSLMASGWELTVPMTDKRGTRRHGAKDGKPKQRWEKHFRPAIGWSGKDVVANLIKGD